MIYITGDTHGEFQRILNFAERVHASKADVMIILGDAGINFSGSPRDNWKKQPLAAIPMKFFAYTEIMRNALRKYRVIQQLYGMMEQSGMSLNIPIFFLRGMVKFTILEGNSV